MSGEEREHKKSSAYAPLQINKDALITNIKTSNNYNINNYERRNHIYYITYR